MMRNFNIVVENDFDVKDVVNYLGNTYNFKVNGGTYEEVNNNLLKKMDDLNNLDYENFSSEVVYDDTVLPNVFFEDNTAYMDEFVTFRDDLDNLPSIEDIAKSIIKEFPGIKLNIASQEKTKRDDFNIWYYIDIDNNVLTIKGTDEIQCIDFYEYCDYEEYKEKGIGNLTEEEYLKYCDDYIAVWVDDYHNIYTDPVFTKEEKYTIDDL